MTITPILSLLLFAYLPYSCGFDVTRPSFDTVENSKSTTTQIEPLKVEITFVRGAKAQGAVCLDGSVPAYHLHEGMGSGKNSWLINLEGGGWCSNERTCEFRKKTRHGSSNYMERMIHFTGILSNKPEENPDFYNWNRVQIRYCDGASFSGDSQDKAKQLMFRGRQIWRATMEELLLKGMSNAYQALLSGCSAGALAAILHCDEFSSLFTRKTKVKCLADAGMFLDATDVLGNHTLRSIFKEIVAYQHVHPLSNCMLPKNVSRTDPALCFFPENLIANVKTPLFLLNAAYDSWQIQESLVPLKAHPNSSWSKCRSNYSLCSTKQIDFFQDFRAKMLLAMKGFQRIAKNGYFINSCFAHCQSERQETWLSYKSPAIQNQSIAVAVGDWFFEREKVGKVDCKYPCDNTCHNLVFR